MSRLTVAVALEDISAGDLVEIDFATGKARVSRGAVVVARCYDPETRRTTCAQCGREWATGQTTCICGADFGLRPARLA